MSLCRTSIALIALPLAAGSVAFAAPAAEVRTSVIASERKVNAVAVELRTCAADIARQAELIEGIAAKAARQQEALRSLGPVIERAMKAADGDVDAARRDISAANQRVREAEARIAQATAEVKVRRQKVGEAAADERAAFERSEAFVRASAEVDRASQAVNRIENDLAAQVKLDVRVSSLLAKSEQAEAEVKRRRDARPADEAALAEASARWMEARSEFEAARRELFARHAPYAAAQASLRDVQRALAELRDTFDRSILTRPGVAEAQLALKDAGFAVTSAEQAAASAREDLSRASARLAARRAAADVLRQIQEETTGRVVAVQDELRLAQASIRSSAQKLASLGATLLSTCGDLRSAAEALAILPADSDKPKKGK